MMVKFDQLSLGRLESGELVARICKRMSNPDAQFTPIASGCMWEHVLIKVGVNEEKWKTYVENRGMRNRG